MLTLCWFCSRSNGVHDLLKLAKQFDFMFHQDEEDEQRSELLSQDVFQPDADPAAAEAEPPMDDDLDFLFDGATQPVSGPLTAPDSSSAAHVQGTLTSDGFEDDWEDDDLLNDSLLLEMTKNPRKFTSPKFCSTQKAPGCGGGPQSPAGPSLDASPAGRVPKRPLSARAGGAEWTGPVRRQQQEAAGGSSSAAADQNLSPRSRRPAGDDPVWDDPADDQLLCELCEDLEKQLQRERERLPPPQQRAALQPANRNLPPPTGCLSKVPAAGTAQTGFQPAPKRSSHYGQYTFKKPVHPMTFKGGGAPVAPTPPPCSAAEIEQKKQQALQRRRRRLQLAQGLVHPT